MFLSLNSCRAKIYYSLLYYVLRIVARNNHTVYMSPTHRSGHNNKWHLGGTRVHLADANILFYSPSLKIKNILLSQI